MNYTEQLQKKSLANRIAAIKAIFLAYVDTETINYYKTQLVKTSPSTYDDLEYRRVELSKKQKEDAIYELRILIRDAEECVNHLKNN